MMIPRRSVHFRLQEATVLWLGLLGVALIPLGQSALEWMFTQATEIARRQPTRIAPASTSWPPDRPGVPRIYFLGEPWSGTHRAFKPDPVITLWRGWGTDSKVEALRLDVADRQIYCGGLPVSLDRISALVDEAGREKIHWVYITARPESSLGCVMRVIEACRQTPVQGIALNGVLPEWAF